MVDAPAADAVYVLVPPTHKVAAPAVKFGVPTPVVTATGKSAVVEPHEPKAVALTVKLLVTLFATPVV
jgi:hypothetical protein